jgi:hypothetical protein
MRWLSPPQAVAPKSIATRERSVSPRGTVRVYYHLPVNDRH